MNSDIKVLIIPGGWCPDKLRRYEECLQLVQKARANNALIGIICHGASVGVSAKILKGVKMTCFHAIKDDVINAGANYVTDRVVSDQQIVTAQDPTDLPEFMKTILVQLK